MIEGARRGVLELMPTLLIGGGIVMIIALHALRPDVHPTFHYISEYGNQSWSWLLAIALVLVAVGLLALGEVMRTATGGKLSPRLMQFAGLMLMVAAVMSTDRQGGEVEVGTIPGKVHGLMSIGAFCLLVLAMASLPRSGEAGGERRSAIGWALPLAVVGTAVAAAAFLIVPEADGLRQRAFLAIVFGWLIAASVELRRMPLHSGDDGPPAPPPGRERPSG